MTDIILETLRSAVLLVIFLCLWRAGRDRAELSRKGWRLLLGGFGLLLFGSAIDITDNFDALNRFVLVGNTETQAFLEKMVGFLGGFVLVAVGLVRWLPTLSSVQRTESLLGDLSRANERLVASESRLLEQAEDRERSRQTLEKILDSIPVGIVIIGKDKVVRKVNSAALALMGCDREDQVMDRECHGMLRTYPKGKRPVSDSTKQAGPAERVFAAKGRTKAPILKTVTPIRLNDEDVLLETFVDVSERKRAEEERQMLLHNMGERVKELNCMYGVADSIRRRNPLEEVFLDVVRLIPHGWHYPEITRGKISFDGNEYVVEPFDETEWKQTSEIIVGGQPCGTVDVYYLEERPELDEGPFMKEERRLLDGLAQALGEAIERRRAEQRIEDYAAVLESANPALEEIS